MWLSNATGDCCMNNTCLRPCAAIEHAWQGPSGDRTTLDGIQTGGENMHLTGFVHIQIYKENCFI